MGQEDLILQPVRSGLLKQPARPDLIKQPNRPDWKYLSEYDYLKEKPLIQFGWEFLRRNLLYQADYREYRSLLSKKKLLAEKSNKYFFYAYYDAEPPNFENESYSKYKARMKKELGPNATYSYCASPYEFYQKYDLAQHDHMSYYNPRTESSPGFKELNEEEYPIFFEQTRRNHGIRANKDELIVKFNVFYPISNQISKLKAEIARVSKEVVVNPTRENAYGDNKLLIRYLRVLDAEAKKATDEEILFYVYFNFFEVNNRPKSPEDLKISPHSKSENNKFPMDTIQSRYKENKEEAIKLRDGDYVSLVKSASHYLNKVRKKEEASIHKNI